MYDEKNVLIEKEDQGNCYIKESGVANDQSEHQNIIAFNYYNNYGNMSLTYNLTGKYDRISGTIYVPDNNKNDAQKGYIEVYGDGKLLYTSPTMTAGVLPQKIDFSVTGVQTMEIQAFGQTSFYSSFHISNLIAQKTVPTE